jgi:hypothetical protein
MHHPTIHTDAFAGTGIVVMVFPARAFRAVVLPLLLAPAL